MTVLHTKVRVGPDGNVVIPVGAAEAGKEVEVTVAPASAANADLINGIPRDEWFAILERTGGSIDDDTFVRPPPRPQNRDVEFDD